MAFAISGATLVGETSGTAFPTVVAAGHRHYRTDLARWAYYDGTRWLTEAEEVISEWDYYPAAQVGVELTASQEYRYTNLRADYAYYLTRWELFGYTNGTNNGTNYWTVTLRTFIGLVTCATHSTASWSGATWTRATAITSFSQQPATSDNGLEYYVTKVGAPGPFRFSAKLFGRLVLT